MKIAIPTRNEQVQDHFGHSESFAVFSIDEDKNITERKTIPSLQGCGCRSNIIQTLKEEGVDTMLAGNMGMGAYEKLRARGIYVIRGCSGTAEEALRSYLRAELIDSDKFCDTSQRHQHGYGHDHDHGHGHHHKHGLD